MGLIHGLNMADIAHNVTTLIIINSEQLKMFQKKNIYYLGLKCKVS